MKRNVPNMITYLNLISGCVACVMALDNNYLWAFIFIIIASIFDFCDGLVARLLKAYSKLGKELDSLADVVSFGVAPGMIIFVFLRNIIIDYNTISSLTYMAYIAFLMPAFSALRLAKFNIDDRQTSSFIGLPTPANALFWGALIYQLSLWNIAPLYLITGIIVGVLLFSYLMISEMPMFSLKFKNHGWKGNEAKYILLLVAILSLVFLGISGISATIVIYILMSLFIRGK